MTAIIVNGGVPFGAMSNAIPPLVAQLNADITRLQAAAAAAASGWGGTAGAEYEGTGNNFGITVGSPAGAKGSDWAFAVGTLSTAWATFLASAQGAITALDNGG